MTTISIEGCKNITTRAGSFDVEIDFEDWRGGTTRIELSKADAEQLSETLSEVFKKDRGNRKKYSKLFVEVDG